MKKRKLFVKTVSLVMAIIMTLAVIPVQAISLPQENEDISNEIVSTGNIETADQEVFIVEEDTSKRDQFEKHYLCSDGTYVSVTYPEAIHYLDDDNIWQDVDQSLTYNGASDVYSSDNADFNISFAAKGSSSNIVRIEKDGYALSWGIQATEKTPLIVSDSAIDKSAKAMSADETIISIPTSLSSAKLVSSSMPEFDKNADRLITNEDSFVLPNISSQISYTNVFGGDQNVTLAYTVYHNKIEEDIIISERGDIHSVSMNMDIGTLTPVVNSDGSVDLVDDDNNMQFHVGIPYMVDAVYSVCNDIHVTAEKDGSNCIITYTPNAEWYDSEDRVFPILLDPAITTNDYISNIVDTYVEENSTVNHSSEQYLYINKNGSNRRKAIVRVTKLPQIDASLPIVSASLSLTAQTAPTSSISLKAGYYDSALDLSEYTYNVISDSLFTYTTSSYLNSGSKTVSFDFSSHVYEMYSDLEFDIEEGYDYCGDFIISFSDNNNSTALAPFFSANYTTPANRPVFTVKYGYTLPAGILNGGVYSFQNVGSFSYMSVVGNPPPNNANVIQVKNSSGVASTTQKFKLEYISSTGGYRLRSMSSSNGTDKLITIQRNSTELMSGQNVRVYSPVESITDEWLIIPVDYDVFRIVPRANMSLTLTAYGTQDGTSTGRTSTSQGNVFIKTLASNNSYQQWYIYDSNNNDVTTSEFRSDIESGNYYISNKYTGRYLHRTNNLGNCMSGTISSLGDETVNWKVVNLGDGYCTIQRSDLAGYFLAATGTSSGSGVKVYQKTTGEIPDTYKWAITTASGGGCLIQNKASGYYLYAENQSANPSSVTVRSRYASGTDNYKRQVWRFAAEEDYLELGYGASFNNIDVGVNKSRLPSITSSADWSSYDDFVYTITSGSEYVSYNSSTYSFTGLKLGTATISATHKTTGITRSFNIRVASDPKEHRKAIIVIPGIFASELFIGTDNPHFKPYTPLLTMEFASVIGSLSTSMTPSAGMNVYGDLLLAPHTIDVATFIRYYYNSISCNENGTSKYEVYTKKYVYVETTNPNASSIPLPSTYDSRYYTATAGMENTYYALMNALHSNSEITDQYEIEFFSYDWRLSNAVSADRLNDFINENAYEEVILVAHSMGGLVASGYLAMGAEQRHKVKEVYMLASPLEGAPEVINVWANTDFSFILPDNVNPWVPVGNTLLTFITGTTNPIQNLFGNYASIYELFPTRNYLSVSPHPYLIHSTMVPGSSGFTSNTPCNSYEESMQYIVNQLPHFSDELMLNAENFHSSCRINNNHITYSVDCTYFYAKDDKTTTQIRCLEYLSPDAIVHTFSIMDDATSKFGDTLVPYWSATVGRSGSFVIECSQSTHMGIMSDGNCTSKIVNLIAGG